MTGTTHYLRVAVGALLGISSVAMAEVTFTVTIDDPAGEYAQYHDQVEQHALAAGAIWAAHLDGTGVIDVHVVFNDTFSVGAESVVQVPVAALGDITVVEQGAAYEVRTGVDPNGVDPDVQMYLGEPFLAQMWFDPQPLVRAAPMPSMQYDALSILLHEYAHAWGFAGRRDPNNGSLPGQCMSTYDRHVNTDDIIFRFIGPDATSVYGGAVPLTQSSYVHVGNTPGLPGADLIGDLMNGVQFQRGKRYFISELDLAILRDAEVRIRPYCPADIDADRWVDVFDLLALLQQWGPCSNTCNAACPSDLNRDCSVNVLDLLDLLSAWGPCAELTPAS